MRQKRTVTIPPKKLIVLFPLRGRIEQKGSLFATPKEKGEYKVTTKGGKGKRIVFSSHHRDPWFAKEKKNPPFHQWYEITEKEGKKVAYVLEA